jgi:hypothetical protein
MQHRPDCFWYIFHHISSNFLSLFSSFFANVLLPETFLGMAQLTATADYADLRIALNLAVW